MCLICFLGYAQEEKVHIGERHLIPKQLKEHGLTIEQIQIPADSVKHIGKDLNCNFVTTMGGTVTCEYKKCMRSLCNDYFLNRMIESLAV